MFLEVEKYGMEKVKASYRVPSTLARPEVWTQCGSVWSFWEALDTDVKETGLET